MLPHLNIWGILHSYNHMLFKNVQYLYFFTINANTTYVYHDREGKKANWGFLC